MGSGIGKHAKRFYSNLKIFALNAAFKGKKNAFFFNQFLKMFR